MKLISLVELRKAVKENTSSERTAKALGVSRQTVTRRVTIYGIDTSHWRRGRNRPTPFEEIFCVDGKLTHPSVKQAFLRLKLVPYICAECEIEPLWNGKELVLQMDHINGNSKDHRIENLRWLCPNCHTQTPTYTNKNANNKS